MRALSIRQPYAEMISPRRVACGDLRGVKTIEYRSRPTRIIGQRFYIYAARKWAGATHNGHDASTLTPALSLQREREFPTGVIVGTATISKCCKREVRDQQSAVSHKGAHHLPSDICPQTSARYEWHLSKVKRLPKPRKPRNMPQPVWFRPF
jgi:hypothetical protein